MNPRIEIRSRAAANWLETNSQWSIDAAPIRRQALIADGVAELVGWPLREDDRTGKEARLPQIIGIVRCGDESSVANIQL